MKIFVSWSGPLAEKIASVVADWIPLVFPTAVPWLSTDGISAGQRGMNEIEKGLQGAEFGIICVTPDNIGAPWLNFEAGAISNAVGGAARVVPLLTGFNSKVLNGPLQVFQAVLSDEAGFESLARSINETIGGGSREQDKLKRAIDAFWPEVNQAMAPLRSESESKAQARPVSNAAQAEKDHGEMIEEILLRVRAIQRAEDDRYDMPVLGQGVIFRSSVVGLIPDASQEEVTGKLRELIGDKRLASVDLSEKKGSISVSIKTRTPLSSGERVSAKNIIMSVFPSVENIVINPIARLRKNDTPPPTDWLAT